MEVKSDHIIQAENFIVKLTQIKAILKEVWQKNMLCNNPYWRRTTQQSTLIKVIGNNSSPNFPVNLNETDKHNDEKQNLLLVITLICNTINATQQSIEIQGQRKQIMEIHSKSKS